MSTNNFNQFVTGLVRKPINPAELEAAKLWYKQWTGRHAVAMDDRELIQIYQGLNCNT